MPELIDPALIGAYIALAGETRETDAEVRDDRSRERPPPPQRLASGHGFKEPESAVDIRHGATLFEPG